MKSRGKVDWASVCVVPPRVNQSPDPVPCTTHWDSLSSGVCCSISLLPPLHFHPSSLCLCLGLLTRVEQHLCCWIYYTTFSQACQRTKPQLMGATYVHWSNNLFSAADWNSVWNTARDPNMSSCGLQVNKQTERRKKLCQGKDILSSCHVYLCTAPVSETGMCVHSHCDH